MTITREEVADAMRHWAAANVAGDGRELWRMEAEAIGFGYRTRAARPIATFGEERYIRWIEEFPELFDYYRLEFEELETSAAGGLGLAWGTYIEDFQEKGRPPERARVRFSQVLSKDESGWKVLLFHRDIQPFDEEGRYPRSLTTV